MALNAKKLFVLQVVLIVFSLSLLGGRSWGIDIGTMTWTPRSDWLNVKTSTLISPKAVGDGVTDDTAAIQAALNYLSNTYVFQSPAVLYFPPGTYKISSTLQFKNPALGGAFSVVGCGSSTIIQWSSSGPAGAAMVDDDCCSGLICTGLTWDGNNVAGCGYFLGASPGYESPVRHENESFRNFTAIGTYSSANPPGAAIMQGVPGGSIASEVMIKNCRFYNCTIGVVSEYTGFQNFMWCIDGCEFENCGTGFGGGGSDFTVTNCHFQGSTTADIAGGKYGVHIRHCTSSGSAEFCDSLIGGVIEDCWIDGWSNIQGIATNCYGTINFFDCTFTHPPAGSLRLMTTTGYINWSNNYAPDFPGGWSTLTQFQYNMNGPFQFIEPGIRFGVVTSPTQTFLNTANFTDSTNIIDVTASPYHADWTGATDSTAAIQSAINAAITAHNGSVVYLPCGRYVLSSSLALSGSNYTVEGMGRRSVLIWSDATAGPIPGVAAGPNPGTMMTVTTPNNITVKQLTFASQGYEAITAISETSTGASSVVYDEVLDESLGGYNYSTFNPDYGPGITLTNLPAGSIVNMPHVMAPIAAVNCGPAQIYGYFLQSSPITVSGTAPKTGFFGADIVEGGQQNPAGYNVVMNDNQNLVLGGYYNEQSFNDLELNRGGGTGIGHVTIQGFNSESGSNSGGGPSTLTVNVNNYAGRMFYGLTDLWNDGGNYPVQISQTGANPIDMLMPDDIFNNGATLTLDTGANFVSSYGQGWNNGVPWMQTLPLPEAAADLSSTSMGYDDLRQLEAVGMSLNYGVTTGAPPVAAYDFEASFNDLTGIYNGTNHGASYTIGAVGTTASLFDGTSGYIQIPAPVSTSCSFSMWLQTSSTGGATGQWYNGVGLVDGYTGTSQADMGTALNGGKFSIGVGKTDTTLTSTVAVNDGKWHHVVGTWNSTSGAMQVYVDGVLNGSKTGPTGTHSAATNFRLGSIQTGVSSGFFKGALDQVEIYNYVLNATQVAYLYNHSRGDIPLSGYWKLGETTGTTSHDYSPYAENATWVNSPTYSSSVPSPLAGTNTGSLLFNGTNQYVSLPAGSATVLPAWQTPRSISVWAKTNTTTGTRFITSFGHNTPNQDSVMFLAMVGTNLDGGGYNDDLSVPNFWVDSNWHHVALTYDGNTAKMYADGTLVASAPKVWTWHVPPLAMAVGAMVDGSGPWSGNVADARIYNRALSPIEVAHLATGSSPGLVAYWKLDEGASPSLDSSYNGLSGTWMNSPTPSTDRPSVRNAVSDPGSLTFNGVNQYVNMGNPAVLPSGTAPRTICGWAKSVPAGQFNGVNGYGMFASYGTAANHEGFWIGANGTALSAGSYGDDMPDIPGFWDGNWHFIALTYDGTTAKLYADGVLKESAAKTWTLVPNVCFVGCYLVGGVACWNGGVDDVRIYNRALSATEVSSLAAGNP